jgi:hypothetical protein
METMDGNAVWDVIVIGGGPAGMMAAGKAAENGAKVILIEKNDTLGKKLLLTGGGRCNFTNSELDPRKFIEKYKDSGKFLFSAFSKWGVKETLEFFHERGIKTRVEEGLRVFPESDSAKTVLDALIGYMKESGVDILLNSQVTNLSCEEKVFTGVKLKNGNLIKGRSAIITTGGTSWPETGSTGDGYSWLRDVGHTISEPSPLLVPISIKDSWVKELAGTSLKNINISAFQNDKKIISVRGDILFTHTGVSGPAIINMSGDIGKMLKNGDVVISLDLFPEKDHGLLNSILQELFKKHDKKKLRNALSDIIPSAVISLVMNISGVETEVECNSVTKEDRMAIIGVLKNIPMRVDGLFDADRSIVASGGVISEEVDFRTMRSRLVPNLYLAGDILDIDRPSGGYSLQLCWTTGRIAGDSSFGAY